MSKYFVTVDCSSFRKYIVDANSKKEAEDIARNAFTCPDGGTEVHEPTRIAKPEDYEFAEEEL